MFGVTAKEKARKLFDINNLHCKTDIVSEEMKLSIMKWYASGMKQVFTVTITDKRIEFIKSLCSEIEPELVLGEEQDLMQILYKNLNQKIELFEGERIAKERAINFYLQDKPFHVYSSVIFFTDLLSFIKKILEFEFQYGVKKPGIVSIDVYIETVPEEYFVVDLPLKDYVEAIKINDKLRFCDCFVSNWGQEIAKEITLQFYINYIGYQNKLIQFENDNKKSRIINIFNWHTGPH